MGKIEIDHTGAGAGITLSSDGTDLLLDGTAVGGSPELYAENPVTPTTPTATATNSAAIGSGADATGNNSFAIGTNTTASGGGSLAIGYNATATTSISQAIGAAASGAGSQAVAGGATAIGGSYASGNDSFAAAIANNTSSYGATGANSVAIGDRAKATASSAVALGFGTASGIGSFAVGTSNAGYASGISSTAIGQGSQATSTAAIALGYEAEAKGQGAVGLGYRSKALGTASVALGEEAVSEVSAKMAYSGGMFSTVGDCQTGTTILKRATTDATPTQLTANGNAPYFTRLLTLPNNSAYAFHGTIVARQQASQGTACAAWKIEGLIRREGSAGTTVLVNSATTILDNTPAWGMALTADVTNGGLAITVTGAAATNIRFVATINTSEVTY